jgi:hypothetical protein
VGLGIGIGIGLGVPLWHGYHGYHGYPASPYYHPGPVVVAPPVVYSEPVPVAPMAAPEPVIYPRQGQSPAQTESDRQGCNRWAITQPSAMADAHVFHRATLACMNGSRELLERILVAEEEHADWLETQLSVIESIGVENYLSQQLHEDD